MDGMRGLPSICEWFEQYNELVDRISLNNSGSIFACSCASSSSVGLSFGTEVL